MSGGPVQLMAFGYSSAAGAEERVMAELDALQGRGLLRLLDFLFVEKTPDGRLNLLDVGDDDDYGTILAGFFPWDEGGYEPPAGDEVDEMAELASSLSPGSAMALVLVEHLWAGGLFSAVEATGGELLSEGFITDEGDVIVGAEVEALSEAAAVIEEAHAAGAAARLEALRAIDEASEVVETAQQIRDAAAAEAVAALIAAGIIEANAANEAADALREAGVITEQAQAAEDDAFERVAEAIAAGRDVESAAEAQAAEAVAQASAKVAAVERSEAEALAREVVESEIGADAARAEAERIAEAAAVQEEAAIDEAEQVGAEAGLREAAAVEEVEATEELAGRLEAASAITPAEKRLLRYLKTELTFAMIADKMGISRGAVKDRASRIYRKLGVHSREEAVNAAVELSVIRG